MRWWLALVVLVTACSDLDAIETGVCGNGAIDENEDCDSSDESVCIACQLRCETTECPTGYACGADQICRAPSGAFYPTDETTFATTDFAVSDVNWDGAGDVLGLTATSINVLPGSALPAAGVQSTSPFGASFTMLTPFGRGDPVFGDFDNDLRPDVLLPTADGIAGFSSYYKTLAPHAFAFNPGGGEGDSDGFAPLLVFSFHPAFVSFLFPASDTGPGIRLGMLDVNSGDTGPNTSFLPIVCTSIVPSEQLSYDAFIVDNAPLTALVAVRDPQNHVCVFRVTVPGVGTDPFAVATLDEALVPNSARPVLADFDGSGCPSLVVAVAKEVRAVGAAPSCTLATTLTSLPADITTPAVGRVRIQTPLQNVGPDALITTVGVFAVTSTRTAVTPLYTSDRPIDSSAFGDINGDGKLDAVLGASNSNGVDVLFNVAGGVFLLYRIATNGFVTHLETGDYDGNGIDDIVYTDRLDDERLMVAYGTPDRPLPPVENGRFTNVISFLPVQISDSIDRLRIVADLAVVDLAGPMQLQLTVLHGSPQRTLVSYFDPRNGGGGNFDPGTGFYAAIAGQFQPSTPETDVIAIEWSRVRSSARLYVNIGIGGGALSQSAEPPTAPMQEPTPIWFNLSGVAEGDKCTASSFCLDNARYLSLPRSPAHRLIGIDRAASPTAIAIDASMLAPSKESMPNTPTNAPTPVPGLEPGTGFTLTSLHAADVDGDGLDDAVAAFASISAGTGEVRVCLDDDFQACPNLASLANAPELVCGDVAPARVQARGPFDPPVEASPAEPAPLVALCDDSLGRAVYRFVAVGGEYTATRLFGLPHSVGKLEVGDVNGDALDDILVLDLHGGTAAPTLRAFLQCRSSDVECRKGAR